MIALETLYRQTINRRRIILDDIAERIVATRNVFCKTGKGGGVDPTCGKGGIRTKLPNPKNVKVLGSAGGTTGARIVMDENGKKWIMKSSATLAKKKGLSEVEAVKRIQNEADADDIYREMGANVAAGGITFSGGTAFKFTEYIEGAQEYGDWKQNATPAMKKEIQAQLRQHFVLDATLANWDVVGLGNDNILIKDGVVYRADNGGSMAYRAQGKAKGANFTDNVGELGTMQNEWMNATSAAVFKGISAKEMSDQAADIIKNKNAILSKISDPKTSAKMKKRIDSLNDQEQFDVHDNSTPSTIASPKKVAKKVTKKPSMDDLDKDFDLDDISDVPGVSGILKGKTASGSTASGAANLSSGYKVNKYIQEHSGSVNFTKLQLQKLEYLNPNGIEDGVYRVPLLVAHKKGHMAQLKKVLPPGTKIVKTNAAKAGFSKVKYKGRTLAKYKPAAPGKGGTVDVGKSIHWKGSAGTYTKAGKYAHISTAKLAQVNWEGSMQGSLGSAISSWKGSAHGIRDAINQGLPPNHPATKKAKFFLDAVQSAPDYHGVVYRGLSKKSGSNYIATQIAAILKAGVGGEWSEPTPHCTSKKASTALGFSNTGGIMMKLKVKTGTDISRIKGYHGEKEVVGNPSGKARYRIISIIQNGKVNGQSRALIVEMEEIED